MNLTIKRMRRFRKMLRTSFALLALTALLASSGCSPPPPATAARKPVAVRAVSMQQQEIRRTSSQPATVHAYYRAKIRAKVSGYLTDLRVDVGDVVSKGQVMAVLDVPEMREQRGTLQARVKLYEAQQLQAEAGVALANANVESARAKLAQVESEANGAEAALAAARAEFERTQDLVERQSLENRVLDEARKRRDAASASRDAARSVIRSASAAVTVAVAAGASAAANLDAAAAETKIAKQELKEQEVMLAYAELRAPFDGVVTARTIDVGDLVHGGDLSGRPLLEVSQVNKLRIQIPVPEIDAAFIDRGDEVALSFPSFAAEQGLTTTVTRLAGSLDVSTRTMLVEAEVENTDGKLLPGMFGRATITIGSRAQRNLLPARAVRFDEQGSAYVYLIEADTVRKVAVNTGIDDGSLIEILSGIEPGQDVIDAHLQRFKDGQRIRRLN